MTSDTQKCPFRSTPCLLPLSKKDVFRMLISPDQGSLLLSHEIQSCIPLEDECNGIDPFWQFKVLEEKLFIHET